MSGAATSRTPEMPAATVEDVLKKLDEHTAQLAKCITATAPPMSATALDVCAIITACAAARSIEIQTPRTVTSSSYNNERTLDGWIIKVRWDDWLSSTADGPTQEDLSGCQPTGGDVL